MQWNRDNKNAGFCNESVSPWNPVQTNYIRRNVQSELEDPTSVLSAYRSIIQLRKDHERCLVNGSMHFPETDDSRCVHFTRCTESDDEKKSVRIQIILNMARTSSSLKRLGLEKAGTCIYSTDAKRKLSAPVLLLGPHEGVCLLLR